MCNTIVHAVGVLMMKRSQNSIVVALQDFSPLFVCASDAGNLFFNDFTAFAPAEQVKNWDRRFAVLKSYPNVLITPHSAFLTKEALRNIARTTLENLMAFSIGEPLVNEVGPREAKA